MNVRSGGFAGDRARECIERDLTRLEIAEQPDAFGSIGTDGHVHELVYKNNWGHTDLTQAAGAPNAAPGSALDGYQTSFNNQQHVNYLSSDNHVHELYY